MALLNEHIDGKYEILGKLREGGMGAIYKVRHRLLDEIRVVKVIRSRSEAGEEGVDRFLREARAAIRLRHPNVAVLHDFAVTEDGQAFIVMEYIDGWNLLEVLNGYGPPPIPLTMEIARQSLKALGYLHRHRIVHRDVSPDNLMLTRDVDGNPLVKLIDLGIAKALEGQGGLTTTGIFLGKPRYGSPERFSGGAWDARSDLYSFGVVLYELLTGQSPISGSEAAALMAGHLFRPPADFAETDPRGRVPPELRVIVMRALAKKPEERMASAEDFLWELTMLQDFFPLTQSDMQAVWGVLEPLAPGSVPSVEPAGSTQHRLNVEFMLGRTPPNGVVTGEATLRTERDAALAEVVPFPQASPPAPAEPDSARPRRVVDGLDLDATWATRPLRKSTGSMSEKPAPERPAPKPVPVSALRGTAVAKPSRAWRVWTAIAVVAIALAAAGYLWLRQPEPGALAAPPPARESATVTPAGPPAAEKTSSPSPPPSASKPEKPPVEVSPAVPPSAPLPDRRSVNRRQPLPEEPAPAAGPLEPMQAGALIRAGQPGVEPPEIRELARNPYPEAAKGSGRKVAIRIAVLVDETGKVIDAQIRSGDNSGLGFEEAALAAARNCRFFPPARDGIAGRMWTEVEFLFEE